MADIESKYFLRLLVKDYAGVLGNIATILGNHSVSFEKLIQTPVTEDVAEIVAITDIVSEDDFKQAMDELRGKSFIEEVSSIIRVYA